MTSLKRAFLGSQEAPVLLKNLGLSISFAGLTDCCFLGIRNLPLLKSSLCMIFFRSIKEAGTNLLGYAGEPFSQGYQDASI